MTTEPLTIPVGDEPDWTPPPGAFTPHNAACLACGGPGWRTAFTLDNLAAQQCQGVPEGDPMAATLTAGSRDDIKQQLTDLVNTHMLWAEITRRRARRLADSDPALAEYLHSKADDFDTAPEIFIGQLSRYQVDLADGRTVRVRAHDEHAAKAKATRKAARRGPFGLLGRKPAPNVTSVAQVA